MYLFRLHLTEYPCVEMSPWRVAACSDMYPLPVPFCLRSEETVEQPPETDGVLGAAVHQSPPDDSQLEGEWSRIPS